MNIKNTFLNILNTKTLRQSSLTSLATFTNGLFGIAFYIIIARLLGPANFGIFSIAVVALTLIADVTNLGTDTGLIRFIGKYQIPDKIKAQRFLKLALEIKLVVWLLILLFGFVLIPFIAETIFLKKELMLPLRLALIGVGGSLLFSFSTSAIQAYQKYLAWSSLTVGSNAIRLLALLLLILVGNLDLNTGLWVYIIIPFLGFLVSLFILPSFLLVKQELSVASEFLHYNKWVALFILLAAISSRLDTFLLTRFVSTAEVGIYSAANQIAGVIPQLVFAIATVVAPKLTSFTIHKQAIVYLKKLQLFVIGLAAVGVLLLPVIIIIISSFYGQEYSGSINVFIILFFAQLIFLVSLPVHQAIFYYFAKPSIFVFISVVHLLIIGAGGYFLILEYGLAGIAAAVLLGSISNFVIPAIWVLIKFKKLK